MKKILNPININVVQKYKSIALHKKLEETFLIHHLAKIIGHFCDRKLLGVIFICYDTN